MKDTGKLIDQLQTIAALLQRHLVIISIVIFALLCGYLLTQANTHITTRPEASAVAEKAQTVGRPTVDERVVDTIQNLQDRNVQVRTIFEEARENPFTE